MIKRFGMQTVQGMKTVQGKVYFGGKETRMGGMLAAFYIRLPNIERWKATIIIHYTKQDMR